MNDEPRAEVTVHGVRLRVPLYKDLATTQAIANTVTDSIQAIEEDSDRIDTQRFALEACVRIATELALERDQARQTEEELSIQLASVNASLESLLKLMQ